MTYEEIANRGGGILNSKNSMKLEEEIYNQSKIRSKK
jgi:hypothetical protein